MIQPSTIDFQVDTPTNSTSYSVFGAKIDRVNKTSYNVYYHDYRACKYSTEV